MITGRILSIPCKGSLEWYSRQDVTLEDREVSLAEEANTPHTAPDSAVSYPRFHPTRRLFRSSDRDRRILNGRSIGKPYILRRQRSTIFHQSASRPSVGKRRLDTERGVFHFLPSRCRCCGTRLPLGDDKGLCIGAPTAVFPVFSVICPDTEGIGTFIVDPIFKAAGGSRAGKGGKSASALKKLYFILVCPIYLIPDGCMTAPVRCKGSRNGPVDSGRRT